MTNPRVHVIAALVIALVALGFQHRRVRDGVGGFGGAVSHTPGCFTDHVCYDIRWGYAGTQAADAGEETWAVDFPIETSHSLTDQRL